MPSKSQRSFLTDLGRIFPTAWYLKTFLMLVWIGKKRSIRFQFIEKQEPNDLNIIPKNRSSKFVRNQYVEKALRALRLYSFTYTIPYWNEWIGPLIVKMLRTEKVSIYPQLTISAKNYKNKFLNFFRRILGLLFDDFMTHMREIFTPKLDF